jgi:DNA polymerase I
VTTDAAVATERRDYTPRFYVAPRSPETDVDLSGLRAFYDRHPDIVATKFVDCRPGFRRDLERVLAVDVSHIDRVTALPR